MGCANAAVAAFFVVAASLAIALAFFFAVFLPADFNFRFRIALFVVALRLPDMDLPFVQQLHGVTSTAQIAGISAR
jgi:hypothetical protein